MKLDGPVIAKADSAQALGIARQMFVAGERVDMRDLANRLDVGRSTLYRWVGDREQLISEVLADLSRHTWELARAGAKGRGLNRAIDVLRRFMTYTSDFLPLRDFVQREPELALRILLRENSPVSRVIRDGVSHAVAEHAPEIHAQVSREVLEAVAEACTALEWTPVIIGQTPNIERALALAKTILSSAQNQ